MTLPPACSKPSRLGRTVLDHLPPGVRRTVRRAAGRPGPRVVRLDSLDAELAVAAELFSRSEDAARRHLDGMVLEPPAAPPPDPFSEQYRRWTWALYSLISGRVSYELGNEASPFDLQAAQERPFPWSTGSPTVIGEDIEARAQVLRCLGAAGLGLIPPAHLVEYGPGWGNLTADLVMTGYRVTAVEVDPNFCALLTSRAETAPLREASGAGGGRLLRIVNEGMLTFRPDAPVDAAVFYECFHHCADHVAMLEGLHDVVRPGGPVIFAGEPIGDMPYPWGPRLDGLSLWSMRTYGWLELGFRSRYFTEALSRTGWTAERRSLRPGAPKAEIVVARPIP